MPQLICLLIKNEFEPRLKGKVELVRQLSNALGSDNKQEDRLSNSPESKESSAMQEEMKQPLVDLANSRRAVNPKKMKKRDACLKIELLSENALERLGGALRGASTNGTVA